ncbi:MAG TPA: hypothetical protein VK927_08215 [Adhaeribacter sp.]|nr:hypothetical protein [Adhaeribacter sp.]
MGKQFNLLVSILFLSVLSACAASKSAGTDKTKTAGKTVAVETKKARTEDLSQYRPKAAILPTDAVFAAAVVPTNHVNQQVDRLLDTLANNNKNIKYAQGYRILVYTGNDRTTAMDLRKTIISQRPEDRDYLTYVQPTYKLKIGDFYTRMEASQALLQIQQIAPKASIVAEQINLNRPK